MSWVSTIMDIYWELRPCIETQELYKKHNLKPFDYWRLELEYLTGSTWAKDAEFCQLPNISYLLDKYRESGSKIRLDEEDKKTLAIAFVTDLGMNPATFALM